MPKGIFLKGVFELYIFLITWHSSNANSRKTLNSILPDLHESNMYRIILNLFLSNTYITFKVKMPSRYICIFCFFFFFFFFFFFLVQGFFFCCFFFFFFYFFFAYVFFFFFFFFFFFTSRDIFDGALMSFL